MMFRLFNEGFSLISSRGRLDTFILGASEILVFSMVVPGVIVNDLYVVKMGFVLLFGVLASAVLMLADVELRT